MTPTAGSLALGALDQLPPSWRFHHRVGAAWESLGAPDLARVLRATARALIAAGVKPGDRVAQLGPNRPEMFMVDLAVMAVGAISVILPDGAPARQLPAFLRHLRPALLFVNGADHLSRLRAGGGGEGPLPRLVTWDAPGPAEPFESFLATGGALPDDALEVRLAAVNPSQPAFIVYSSGTTAGPDALPRAIVHDHWNFLFLASQMRDEYGLRPGEVVLAFVPLCHMPARLGMLLALTEPYDAWMSPDLKTFAPSLQEVRPTFLPGVPRLFEKVASAVLEKAEAAPGPARALLQWALAQGRRHHLRTAGGEEGALGRAAFQAADRLVLGKIRGSLGGRVDKALCGGAPVDPEILRFFASLGIRVRETYGMTEVGVICIQPPEVERFGSVGAPAAGVEVSLAPDGEILVRSPGLFKGYWDPDRGVVPAVDAEGLFHTGDLGRWMADGSLKVLDRKGSELRTTGGKLVAPGPLEAALTGSRFIERAVVVGDGRAFPAALLWPEVSTVEAWAAAQGLSLPAPSAWGEVPALRALLDAEITRAMEPFPGHERVKRYALLPAALTAEAGELTDGGKTRRPIVLERYAGLIAAIYTSPS